MGGKKRKNERKEEKKKREKKKQLLPLVNTARIYRIGFYLSVHLSTSPSFLQYLESALDRAVQLCTQLLVMSRLTVGRYRSYKKESNTRSHAVLGK